MNAMSLSRSLSLSANITLTDVWGITNLGSSSDFAGHIYFDRKFFRLKAGADQGFLAGEDAKNKRGAKPLYNFHFHFYEKPGQLAALMCM